MALLGQLTNSSGFDDVAEAIIKETIRRGYKPNESVACLSTAIQESGLRMVWSPNGKWYGYYQQDSSYPDRMDPNGNIRGFLDRLDVKRKSPGASFDIWLNIFWLQQRPSEPSADLAYQNGRKAYLTEIQRHTDQAQQLYERFKGGSAGPNPALVPEPGFSGDPWWLADVLRAEGLKVVELEGWKNRGQGDQYRLWGVMCHHTGGHNSPVSEIAFHPTLGLAAHIHLAKDGTVTVCGIGKANHAGRGSYPGLPEDNANPYTIAIEAVNLPPRGAPHRTGWPDVQYDAYVKVCAAICRKLGVRSDRVISHAEWAGAKQGKWDPGSIDMNIMRRDIQARIDGFNPISGDDDPLANPEIEKFIREIHACLFNQIPSQSIYRTPGEGARWKLHELIKNMDAKVHEEYVETEAKRGNLDELERVIRVADGAGAVTDKWAIDRAKRVLAEVPEEVLQEWREKRGKKAA